MNYIDAVRQMLDTIGPLQDELRRSIDQSRLSVSARELVRILEAFEEAIPDIESFLATKHGIEDAVRPLLPNLERTTRLASEIFEASDWTWKFAEIVPADWNRIDKTFSRLNSVIGAADFVADVDFPDDDAPGQEPEEEARARLVELIPAEILEKLERVEFAPLTLLERARREPEVMRALSSRDFEGFIAALVDQLGFEDVILTPRSGDEGRDVLATKTLHGLTILFAFECKRWAPGRGVGPDVARALLGTIVHDDTRAVKGVLVTTSYFTKGARKFILTEPSLDSRDFDGVVDWLREYGLKRSKE